MDHVDEMSPSDLSALCGALPSRRDPGGIPAVLSSPRRRGQLFWLLIPALALLLPQLAPAAVGDPEPLVQEVSRKTRPSPRILGIGWSTAIGCLVGDRPLRGMSSVTFDLAFEVRLFPKDELSFDFQFDLGETLVDSIVLDDRRAFHFKAYLHVHQLPDVVGYFAAAPYLGFRVYDGAPSLVKALDAGARVGGEVMRADGLFAMGFYGRLGFLVSRNADDEVHYAQEVALELTWTGYVRGE